MVSAVVARIGTMISALRNLFTMKPTPPPPVVASVANPPPMATPTFMDEPVPCYPERSAPLPAVPPELLLQAHQETIAKIRVSLGMTRDEFELQIQPVLLRYAERVHLLPASESDHHCGRGGMLRHGLEAMFFAVRLAEGRVFAMDALPEYRQHLDPKWRIAVALAALLHDVGKVVVDVNAISEDGTARWSGHSVPLWEWLQRHQLSNYYIYWNPGRRSGRHVSFGPLLLREMLGGELMDWLSSNNGHEIMDRLVTAFTAPEDKTNPIAELANEADRKSADFDLQDQAKRLAEAGKSSARASTALLIREMRAMVEEGTWRINHPGTPLFLTTEGLFGLPPNVLDEPIRRLQASGQLKAFPMEKALQFEELIRVHAIEPHNGRPMWFITVPTREAQMEVHALKFATPDAILGGVQPPTPILLKPTGPAALPPLPGEAKSDPPATPASTASAPAAAGTSQPAPAAPHPPSASPTSAPTPPVATPAASTSVEGQASASETPGENKTISYTEQNIARIIADITPENPGTLWIRSIMERFASGELVWGRDATFTEGKAMLRYPEVFTGMGLEPAKMRDLLASHEWLIEDPAQRRLVITIETNFGSFKGCFCAESTTQLWNDLAGNLPVYQPPSPVDEEDGATAAQAKPGLKRINRMVLGRDVGTDIAKIKPEVVETLKHQLHTELVKDNLAKPPKSTKPEDIQAYRTRLRKRITSFWEARDIDRQTLFLVLTSTDNPLCLIEGEGKNLQILLNPRYRSPFKEDV